MESVVGVVTYHHQQQIKMLMVMPIGFVEEVRVELLGQMAIELGNNAMYRKSRCGEVAAAPFWNGFVRGWAWG